MPGISPFLWFDSQAEDAAKFYNESISFVIRCESQEEVDRYWNRLTEGGDPKAQRAFAAMMKMKKLVIADLQRAYDGT